MARFVGVPRSVVAQIAGGSQEFREIGNRMLAQAISTCPVSEDTGDDGGDSTHLRDTLVAQFISGADPRILLGTRTQGDKLTYVTDGTEPHSIDPVNASVLRFTTGGTTVFAAHVDHPGTTGNDFLLQAARSIAQENL